MFFLPVELKALFKAKRNLNHSSDISLIAGTWAFVITFPSHQIL